MVYSIRIWPLLSQNPTISIADSHLIFVLELWMGVHPNGPSVLAETGESLSAHLTANPELLGEPVSTRFNSQLPFLFKVLRCFISSPLYVCSSLKV